MTSNARLPLAMTMGDAAGIGPEIVARYFLQENPSDIVVFGASRPLKRAMAAIGGAMPVLCVPPGASLPGGVLPVIECGTLPDDLPLGRVDARAGQLAYDSVCRAIDLAKAGEISAIVTAPLHKEAMAAAGIRFPGHTEILAHRTGTTDFGMMLAEGPLRVILVSIHVSLRKALDLVTEPALRRTFRLAAQACRALGIENPRIAVAGLNPHAGEGGLFGEEDQAIIAPAIAKARAEEGLDLSGPHPPDTVFMRARRGEFDIVVAQYHDQGLIPIKLNGIEKGVNVTVGLPIIRTSVDHGTAFDIAAQYRADPSSLGEAVTVARRMIAIRTGKA